MNLAGIDLNLLVALDALLEESSVTRAAERVGLSQSAMSHALRRLRVLLGDPILTPSSRGMVPTARARSLAAPVHRALEQIQHAFEPPPAFDPMTSTHTFTLSMQDTGQAGLLPALVGRLKTEAPHVDLRIHPSAGGMQSKELEMGTIDLALTIFPEPQPGFHAEAVIRSPYEVIMRTGHPAVKKRLTLKKFTELGHIVVSRQGIVDPDLGSALSAHGLGFRAALTVPSLLPVPWLVARSDLIATVPVMLPNLIPGHFPIRRYKPPIPIEPIRVSIVWHERTHFDPAHQWMRHAVKQTCRALSGRRREGASN